MQNDNILITCECAPNIALIKYWGKSNEELILPLNGSISITLDRNVLSSKTSLLLFKPNQQKNDKEKKISIFLNGKKQEFDDDLNQKKDNLDLINKKRFLTMLNKVRNNCSIKDPFEYHIRINSFNNFPTACGLASSASGFACMAHCLSKAYQYKGDTSELARLGSGSACRSCFGGFVKWSSGGTSDQSIASVLFPANHWPEMNIIALVLEDGRKSVSSTNGMKDSVLTSELLKHRVKLVEEQRLNQMEEYIRTKDFNKFAKLVIQDSNSFHAVCMDTYPPLFYLNEKSKEIIQFINEFNKIDSDRGLKVAYSFDAGPNCFLFVLDENINDLIYLIFNIYFKYFDVDINEFMSKSFIFNKNETNNIKLDMMNVENNNIDRNQLDLIIEMFKKTKNKNSIDSMMIIKYLIHSKVGKEPIIYENNDLLNSILDLNGMPKEKS